MKRRYHLSLAGISAAVLTWNELWHVDIHGTGQPAAELLRLGYDKLWVASVLSWNWLTAILLVAFIGFSGLAVRSRKTVRRRTT